MQNQSKNAITFDTQLKTALCVSQVTNGFGVALGGSKKESFSGASSSFLKSVFDASAAWRKTFKTSS